MTKKWTSTRSDLTKTKRQAAKELRMKNLLDTARALAVEVSDKEFSKLTEDK